MSNTECICIGRDFYVLYLKSEQTFNVLTQKGDVQVSCQFFTSTSMGALATFVRMTVRRPRLLLLNIGSADVSWAYGHKDYIAPHGCPVPAGWQWMELEKASPLNKYRCQYIWPVGYESFTSFKEVLALAT